MGRTRKEKKERRLRQYFSEPSMLGANVIADPTFSPATLWTFGAGWTNTTPTASCDGNAASVLTWDGTGQVTAGKTYLLTINQGGIYAGIKPGLNAAMGGLTGLDLLPGKDGSASAKGVWEAVDFNLVISNVNLNDFVGIVTNIILQEVL